MSQVRDRYVYIYEDIGGTPFYVGVGKGRRMEDHVRRAKMYLRQYPHNAKCQYVADCIDRGFPPDAYKIAEDLTIAEAMEIEASIIKQLGRRDLGTGPLLNACDGGYGVKNFSDETKALISARVREATASPEIRLKMSDAGKERFSCPVRRAKYSDRTKDQWASEEGRAKFAAKAKSRWTPELRARQAELTRKQLAETGSPMAGKKHSAESIAKMRESSKSVWTPEKRKLAAARMQGKKLSDETRAKMRASHRARVFSEVEAQA